MGNLLPALAKSGRVNPQWEPHPWGGSGERSDLGMKSTGIVRKIDSLGRVVLPVELRRALDIHEGDPLEIYVTSEGIMLRKYSAQCTFCGREDELETFRGKYLCRSCRAELARPPA